MSSSNILIVLVQNTDKTPQKKRNIRNYVSFFYLFISHEKEKQTKNIYKKKVKKRLEILFFIDILKLIIRGDQTKQDMKTIEILFTYIQKDTGSPDLIVCLFIYYKIAMKYQKKCECCGHIITAYTHKLGKQQVEMLQKLIRFNDEKHRPAIISEIGLTPVQYSIFSKMKHWKFIQTKEIYKTDGEITMGRIATDKARQFINGRIQVENRVASMNGKTLSPFHEAWTTDEKGRKMVYVWEISDEKSKQLEEYKKEKGSIFRRLFE